MKRYSKVDASLWENEHRRRQIEKIDQQLGEIYALLGRNFVAEPDPEEPLARTTPNSPAPPIGSGASRQFPHANPGPRYPKLTIEGDLSIPRDLSVGRDLSVVGDATIGDDVTCDGVNFRDQVGSGFVSRITGPGSLGVNLNLKLPSSLPSAGQVLSVQDSTTMQWRTFEDALGFNFSFANTAGTPPAYILNGNTGTIYYFWRMHKPGQMGGRFYYGGFNPVPVAGKTAQIILFKNLVPFATTPAFQGSATPGTYTLLNFSSTSFTDGDVIMALLTVTGPAHTFLNVFGSMILNQQA